MNKNMFKQSLHQTKLLLLIIAVIIFVVIAVAILTRSIFLDKNTSTNQEQFPVVGDQSQTETAKTPSAAVKEAQKKLEAINDQVNAGTLSIEEAKEKMEALRDQIAPSDFPTVAPANSSTVYVSKEEFEKQFKAIDDQVKAGTLSVEEARKKIENLAVQNTQ